jgi:hypothetical protein
MTKEERAEIARKNGAKSKGPKTEAGRAQSSRNALKTGEHARNLSVFNPNASVLCNERRDDFKQLLAELIEIYLPINQLSLSIVKSIAVGRWQIERLNVCLTIQWNMAVVDAAKMPPALAGELADQEIMAHASRDLYSGDAIGQRINRQIDQLETRIARLERRLKFAQDNFPNVASKPAQTTETEGESETTPTENEPSAQPAGGLEPPTVFITEPKPEVIAAYKRDFPGCKIVVLPPDDVAKGKNIRDDMPNAPRKAA